MTGRGMDQESELNAQYGTTERLQTRASVWHPVPGTVAARDAVVTAVAEAGPVSVLDVGCGTGDLTRQIAEAVPDAAVIGVDRSAAMVAATRERGVTAQVATVTALPFEDDSFDVVTCCWVLYHVPDICQALREIARVLRPGGRAVVVTNAGTHLAGLFADSGVTPLRSTFPAEQAPGHLLRHFGDVEASVHPSRAHFETRADAERYLATLPGGSVGGLPAEGWPREYDGCASLFVCSRPQETPH